MSEKKQDYNTHRRIVPGFHVGTFLLALSIFIGGLIQCISDCPQNLFSGMLFAGTGLALTLIALYARQFAAKAQDRAIRAEENFRHFILTGKPLDSRLTPSQIVALRFASDAEFPSLAMKAADQRIKNDDIKKLIQDWRADHHRV
jgi:Family of unknown function (DUF6526)